MAARRLAIVVALVAACGDGAAGDDGAVPDAGPAADAALDAAPTYVYPFALPPGFPEPRLAAPLTVELAELGRHLFYDVRLSGNQTQACASCHQQARAFATDRVVELGSTGEAGRRNAPSLANSLYNPTQTWANPVLESLEDQALVPLFGEFPLELGASGDEDEILARLAAEPVYPPLFADAFPDDDAPFTMVNVVRALAAFERRLVSGNSLVDRAARGEAELPADVARGKVTFQSEELQCHHCHGGFNFTHAVDYASLVEPATQFLNTGLYNVGGAGAYPATDQGLFEFTTQPADRGRYKPPTLRNVGVTAPYMHDGSVATLEEVVAIYERGGRLVTDGPNAGDGADNPYKSFFVSGFSLTPEERTDLVAFLRALTDDTFLTDPTLADPWPPAAAVR